MRPRWAVSRCLLGDNVRYNAETKRHAWIAENLSRYVDIIPLCPEVEAGLPTPRPPMDIVMKEGKRHAIEISTQIDHTERLLRHAHERIATLKAQSIEAMILKARSPSCDVHGITGLFAHTVKTEWPECSLFDEGQFNSDKDIEHILGLMASMKSSTQ